VAEPSDAKTLAEKLLPWSQILSHILIPVLIVIFGATLQNTISKRSTQSSYTELAISILAEPNKKEIDPKLREWAAELLGKNSPIKLPIETIEKLSQGAIALPPEVESELTRLRKYKETQEEIVLEKLTAEEISNSQRQWKYAPPFMGSPKEETGFIADGGGQLNLIFTYKKSNKPRDTVIGQYPEPGDKLHDLTVVLILSDGAG
jgi:hypothetical protein